MFAKRILRSRAGLTLIEMSILVGIIGIVFAVSYPSLIVVKKTHVLYTEAQKVLATIKYAQQIAIDDGVSYKICFTSGNSSYVVRNSVTSEIKLSQVIHENVTYNDSGSTGLLLLGTEKYFEVTGETGVINSAIDVIVALKNGSGNIYIKISPGRKIDISWT